MSLVLDASLTLSWFFRDERTADTDRLLSRVEQRGATVPALWRLDVANGLQASVRRGRLDRTFRDASLSQLARLPITVDPDTDRLAWTDTLGLSDRFALTLYDAAYLELARRRRLPLATLDRQLRNAGEALTIELLGVG